MHLLILQAIPHTTQLSCYCFISSLFGQSPEVQWDSSATHAVNIISHFCVTPFQLSQQNLYSTSNLSLHQCYSILSLSCVLSLISKLSVMLSINQNKDCLLDPSHVNCTFCAGCQTERNRKGICEYDININIHESASQLAATGSTCNFVLTNKACLSSLHYLRLTLLTVGAAWTLIHHFCI